jgi:hypothetical protein
VLEQKEVTVGGKQYVLQQLPTTHGIQVAVTIGLLIAGAAEGFDIIEAADGLTMNPARVVAGVLKRTHPEQTPALLKKLVTESVIRPEMSSDFYEMTFAGHYDDLYDLVAEVLSFNGFADLIKKKLPEITRHLYPADTKDPASTLS